MTRSEAAQICQLIKFMLDKEDYSEEVEEALNMAIKALEQKPSEDCIDRYSALAELHPLSYEYKAIKELPSVVPKGSDEQ